MRTISGVLNKYGRHHRRIGSTAATIFDPDLSFISLPSVRKEQPVSDFAKYLGSSQFLAKTDVPSPIVATIGGTSEHQFPGENSPKLILHWQQPPGLKPMSQNVWNATFLAATFGITSAQQLIGKTVEIYVDPTVRNPAGQVVGGLRLRAPTQPVAQQPVQQVQQQPAPQPFQQQQPAQQQPPQQAVQLQQQPAPGQQPQQGQNWN